MKLNIAIKKLGKRAESIAKVSARRLDLNWEDGMGFIFKAIRKNPALIPNIGGTNDSAEEAVFKWVTRYDEGYKRRISKRVSKLPGTVADPIIDKIIHGKLAHLTESDLEKISFSHRLSMSAENILGLLLEEFLAQELLEFHWYCSWGESMKSVDFVNRDGDLMQIKNRSNSENSSSNKVRVGTSISKWYRVDASTGRYMWEELNTKFSTKKFSEKKFIKFVTKTIQQNKDALSVEVANPWLRLF